MRVQASLLALALTLAALPEASAQEILYSGTLRGELVVTGNTLGLDANSGTAPGTGGAIGTFVANPKAHAAAQEGTYPVGTTSDYTQNGSEAVLDLPDNASVVRAQLVWACSSQIDGSPTTPATTPPEVNLTLPSGVQQTVSVQGEDTTLSLLSTANKYYQRWADVTAHVQTGGAGRYMVSRVVGTQAVGPNYITGCGWSLFVVYAAPDLPMRNITLWTIGQEVRDDGDQCPCTATIDVAGFCTPDIGQAEGRLVVTAMEGDARFTDDTLTIADPLFPGDFYPLSGPNNAWDNFFASQVNGSDGLLDTRGTFGDRNHVVDPFDGTAVTLTTGARQSWDVTTIPLNDDAFNPWVLENGQSETSFVASSGGIGAAEGDDYIIVAMGLALDFESPDLASLHEVDRTATFEGDVVTYTVTLVNEGPGRADQTAFCFEGSANSTFLSLALDGQSQGATAADLAPANCQAATGGHPIGAFDPGASKVLTLRYRVDSLTVETPEVRGTPSWRMEWRPNCEGADFEVDRQTGELAIVPGVVLQATLAVSPTTPPNVESGDTLTYTRTITNVGGGDSPATTVARLPLPPSTTYVAGSTTLNGAAVADAAGAMPFVSPRAVQSPGAPEGVVRAGESAVIVFRVTIVTEAATTISETGFVDPDGAGAQAERASNTVVTQVDGPVAEDDQDRDGIPDSRDNCPTVWNADQADNYPPPSGNGIGDACDDVDKDGIVDLDEDLGPDGTKDSADDTDPMNPDTDGDGLCDGNVIVAPCVGVEDVDGDFDGADRGTVETDPNDPDTDGDGLCDGFQNGGDCLGGEDTLDTDPLDTDSDDDGLCDGPGGGAWDASGCVGSETGGDGAYDVGVDTNPIDPDSDDDGLCDGFVNGTTLCRGAEDRDGDRDVADWTHPGGSESNPLDPDTDDGGVRDGVEHDNGTNPRDPCEGDNQDCTPAPDLLAEGGACAGGSTGAGGTLVFLFAALAVLALASRRRI
ncbi:MAG: DUF11 domain-containing protein [Deltaproteobacteria bacterium]|nr:DUF11 domain-containing protein [Deltaproteobacteria bacterium]